MKRKIIHIDEEKCNGCGLCIPACHEGALQVIDGKVRLISDLFCDGLGACIGHCPEDAISIEEREAEAYNEYKVMDSIVKKGRNTILAHLEHLRNHNEQQFLQQAIDYIKDNKIDMSTENGSENHLEILALPTLPAAIKTNQAHASGCPGSIPRDFRINMDKVEEAVKTAEPMQQLGMAQSALKQWPVQLHLLNPNASYFKDTDVLLTADCVAFAMGDFHNRFLQGHSLAIACPKLDTNKESYVEKLTAMISEAGIRSLNVIIMEVPCCSGLVQIAKIARDNAGRHLPLEVTTISIAGEILEERTV
ncbi:MAG: 4Fe-4S binding protein [Bacteroidetes bacterium]|nr:4Fe-4S binding protein [Bacteroidota bacterium]